MAAAASRRRPWPSGPACAPGEPCADFFPARRAALLSLLQGSFGDDDDDELYPSVHTHAFLNLLEELNSDAVDLERKRRTQNNLGMALQAAERGEKEDVFALKFGLSGSDRLIMDFPCSLMRGIMLQGHMYITNRLLCFDAVVTDKLREGPAVLRGYLEKHKKKSKLGLTQWTTRYFTLEEDVLMYAKDEKAKTTKGIVPLQFITHVRTVEAAKKAKHQHLIELQTANRTYLLAAKDHASLSKWMHAIQWRLFALQSDKLVQPVIPICTISKLTMENYAFVFPNSISLGTDDDQDFFFTSIPDCERVFERLRALWETERSVLVTDVTQRAAPVNALSATAIAMGAAAGDDAPPSTTSTASSAAPSTPSASPAIPLGRRTTAGRVQSSPSFSGASSFSRARMPSPQQPPSPRIVARRRSLDLPSDPALQRSPLSAPPSDERASPSLAGALADADADESAETADESKRQRTAGDEAAAAENEEAPTGRPAASSGGDEQRAPIIVRRHRRLNSEPNTSFDAASLSPLTLADGAAAPTSPVGGRPSDAVADSLPERTSPIVLSPTIPAPSPSGQFVEAVERNRSTNKTSRFFDSLLMRAKPKQPPAHHHHSASTPNMLSGVETLSPESPARPGSDASTSLMLRSPAGETKEMAVLPASSNQVKSFRRRFPELANQNEVVINSYTCALLRGILLQGRLYVCRKHVCFYTKIWKKSSVVVAYADITRLEKDNTAYVFPNAISISTAKGKELFFASFVHRQDAYRLMLAIWRQAIRDRPLATPGREEWRSRLSSATQSSSEWRGTGDAPLDGDADVVESLHVTILAVGMVDDVEPFIALGIGLRDAGHVVTLATHVAHRPLVEVQQLEFAPLSGDPGELARYCTRASTVTSPDSGVPDNEVPNVDMVYLEDLLTNLLLDCWDACQGTNAIIATPAAMGGVHVAERLGVPLLHAFSLPWTRTRAFPNPFAVPSVKLGGSYNYMTYLAIEQAAWRPLHTIINNWRVQSLGLSAIAPTRGGYVHHRRIPYIYSFSQHLIPKPFDWPEHITVTGPWLLGDGGRDGGFVPSDELRAFLSNPSIPVILLDLVEAYSLHGATFVRDLVFPACKEVGCRCIVVRPGAAADAPPLESGTGLGGFVLEVDRERVPISWMLGHVVAAVSHGTSVMTSRVARAGVPHITVPAFGEQYFWGLRVADMGLGPKPIPCAVLSVERLRVAFSNVLSNSSMISTAVSTGLAMGQEHGVENAVNAFQRCLDAYARGRGWDHDGPVIDAAPSAVVDKVSGSELALSDILDARGASSSLKRPASPNVTSSTSPAVAAAGDQSPVTDTMHTASNSSFGESPVPPTGPIRPSPSRATSHSRSPYQSFPRRERTDTDMSEDPSEDTTAALGDMGDSSDDDVDDQVVLETMPGGKADKDKGKAVQWSKGDMLGRGATSVVFAGLDRASGRMIAVKQFNIAAAEMSRDEIDTYYSEIELMRELGHPNIIEYLGAQQTSGHLDILMEYVPGGSLHSHLKKFGAFDEPLIRLYTRQILSGLEYLHNHGIIHRDIKAANILVTDQGTIKLSDFGCSKRVHAAGTQHQQGHHSTVGTPNWMAPEVIQRNTRPGRKSDIWSLGCTIVEMATGAAPWSHLSNQFAAMYQITVGNGRPPLPDSLSQEAHDFLDLCFVRDPEARADVVTLKRHPFVTTDTLTLFKG